MRMTLVLVSALLLTGCASAKQALHGSHRNVLGLHGRVLAG
jgi:uncharacterized protein YcfL